MDIDNIELTSSICESLFSNKLVDTKSSGKLSNELKNPPLEFLGDNRKNIVFLVNNEKEKFVSNEEIEVLNNLLTACKMTIGDISLVNFYPCRKINYETLTEKFNAKFILLFGVSCAQLGLPFNIPDYQIQKYQEANYFTRS